MAAGRPPATIMGEKDSNAPKDYSGPIPVKVVDRRWWARQDPDEPIASAEPELKPTYVEDLERQLKEKNELLQQYMTRYKQASDDFDAAKARMRREIAKDVERGRRVMIVELLDVLDNLERATDAARAAADPAVLLEGVELVQRQFLARLEGFGAKRMDALGAPFSPQFHEAVSTVPTTDPDQDGIVVGVIRPGYQTGDDVLRPALVAVAKLT
jgi:molecular chaperone GrpE